MSSTTGDRIWPLGLRIRPAIDPGTPQVEVADTVSGKRFRWSGDALSAFILRGEDGGRELTGDRVAWERVMAGASDRSDLAAEWRHWQERGWYPSDQYYMASRRFRFADVDDPDGAIRTRVVSQYLAAEGPPVETIPDGPRVTLPSPPPPREQSMARLLVTRRSGRAYNPAPVPAEWLSGLLWYALAGVRKRRTTTSPSRPISYLDSFGSAWDFQVCVFAVEGVRPGAYRYDLDHHELVEVTPGDHREAMAAILQGMWSPRSAAWTLGLVADFPRYQWRYRHEHGLRRLYFESGVIAQELIIVGSAYGMSSLVTPAQQDTPYLDLHGLSNDRYAPVYTVTMGRSRGARGIDFAAGSGGEVTAVAPVAGTSPQGESAG